MKNNLKFRKATIKDLTSIVEMLVEDELGKTREVFEKPLPSGYLTAFEQIDDDPDQELIVVENENAEIIGTMQLSFIRYLTFCGGLRAQIEAVRIRKDNRGRGIGRMMLKWAENRAKERNAHLLQLTTDKRRPETIEFYIKMGFKASHEGMKMHLC